MKRRSAPLVGREAGRELLLLGQRQGRDVIARLGDALTTLLLYNVMYTFSVRLAWTPGTRSCCDVSAFVADTSQTLNPKP